MSDISIRNTSNIDWTILDRAREQLEGREQPLLNNEQKTRTDTYTPSNEAEQVAQEEEIRQMILRELQNEIPPPIQDAEPTTTIEKSEATSTESSPLGQSSTRTDSAETVTKIDDADPTPAEKANTQFLNSKLLVNPSLYGMDSSLLGSNFQTIV